MNFTFDLTAKQVSLLAHADPSFVPTLIAKLQELSALVPTASKSPETDGRALIAAGIVRLYPHRPTQLITSIKAMRGAVVGLGLADAKALIETAYHNQEERR